ncbi:MAG TPA: DUF1015 family protein [Chitinophagaceae bacterium]|nr:DUF1015 family protein [Chitinophagaceae bacterium]
MANIKPFKALRPQKEYAAQLASKPYDVLNSEEARKETAGNHLSFLHVTKAEIDLPADTDAHSPAVYKKAKSNLDYLIAKNILFGDDKPCYYIYELAWKGRSQTGLVCVSSIKDYFDDVIKKHEHTRPEKEKDRIDHMIATRAQTGNVFLACKDNKELNDILEQAKEHDFAEYNFVADDGVNHTIWVIENTATINTITQLFKEKIPFTYIADGHHRAASAAKVSKQLNDSEDAQYFLTTIFPANQLAILDYNRLAKDLNGLPDKYFLKKLEANFSVEKTDKAFSPSALHQFGMYMNKQWYKLTAKENSYTDDPIDILDVTILQENVLNKLLNIKDPRTDGRVDFVGGIRGLAELEKRVNDGEAKLAFSLHPVSIQQLFDIADSGKVMPPKSTWFEPKLRDGLLTHCI